MPLPSKWRPIPREPTGAEPPFCSTDLRLQILHGLPFFAGLNQTEIAAINPLFHERGHTPGETIYAAGDPAGRLYVVATGKVKILRHTLAGKDVLLDLLAPGEFFGALSPLPGEEYPDTAVAQTVVCALGISSEDFRRVLDRFPPVALKVLDISQARLGDAQEMVRRLSASTAEQRVAYALLKLGGKLGAQTREGLLIQAPLSRSDLAEMAGLTTETASRVMSQLQRDGLIRSGRQWVALTDLARLRRLAEGESPGR